MKADQQLTADGQQPMADGRQESKIDCRWWKCLNEGIFITAVYHFAFMLAGGKIAYKGKLIVGDENAFMSVILPTCILPSCFYVYEGIFIICLHVSHFAFMSATYLYLHWVIQGNCNCNFAFMLAMHPVHVPKGYTVHLQKKLFASMSAVGLPSVKVFSSRPLF